MDCFFSPTTPAISASDVPSKPLLAKSVSAACLIYSFLIIPLLSQKLTTVRKSFSHEKISLSTKKSTLIKEWIHGFIFLLKTR